MELTEFEDWTGQHKAWLDGGRKGIQPDLKSKDYVGMDFSNLDLSYADLSDSNLCGCKFNNTTLINAVMRGIQARFCDFSHADMRGSILHGADLAECNFFKTDFRECVGNGREVKSVSLVGGLPITYTLHWVFIGCTKIPVGEQPDEETILKYQKKYPEEQDFTERFAEFIVELTTFIARAKASYYNS